MSVCYCTTAHMLQHVQRPLLHIYRLCPMRQRSVYVIHMQSRADSAKLQLATQKYHLEV